MLVVMTLGGNALVRRHEPLEAETQQRNLVVAVAQSVAPWRRSRAGTRSSSRIATARRSGSWHCKRRPTHYRSLIYINEPARRLPIV